MKEVSAKITGKVQGVGFRAYTKKQADKLGLSGWVKNMDDGSVEAVAQGPEDKLETFVGHLKDGPYFADVEHCEVRWEDTLQDQLTEFTIERD